MSQAGRSCPAQGEVPTVLISGAGIAGISLALFLSQSGRFRVRLFERAPELRPSVGAHFGLNGALVCLDRAGLRHVWEPLCSRVLRMRSMIEGHFYTDVNVEEALAGSDFEGRFGVFMRGELQAALVNGLPDGVLELAKQIVDIHDKDCKVRVDFKDGTSAEGDLLIATDGINSVVRHLVFGGLEKSYAGQQMWMLVHNEPPPPEFRGFITDLPSEDALTLCVSAGATGQQVIVVVKHAPEPSPEDLARDSTPERFAEVLAESGAIAAGMITEERVRTAERLLHFGLYNMPPTTQSWASGRVCLLGDAIHATTPFMGQGANQAVQSAFCLARLLEERGVDEYASVFRDLRSIREPTTSRIISLSGTAGRLRIPSKDEGRLAKLRRGLFYMVMRWAPKTFVRMLTRAWEVHV